MAEILRQEREACSKFGAPAKNLTCLEESFKLLADHIQTGTEYLRMNEIHAAESLNFSLWEDRKVIPAADIKMDLPDLDGEPPDNSIQALEKGLLALQNEPKSYELKDLTYAVLSLDTSDLTKTCQKGKYLLELGKVYSNISGMPALNRALSWTDLAIATIQNHPDATPTNRTLLECYEHRGVLKLKKAAELQKLNKSEETLPRQQVDEGSRDFNISYLLEKGVNENFIRKMHQGKSKQNGDLGLKDLEEAVAGDIDYAEARYHNFLKEFQKLQFDSSKMLHRSFERLANESESQVMQAFKHLLCRTSHLPEGVIVKIKLSSGTLFVKCDSQGILINRADQKVLTEILTKGVKKVSFHDPRKGKIYFCQRISQEDLYKTVLSLGTYKKRLREIEKGIQLFHSFEITSLYKMSLKNEEAALNCDSVRDRLDKGLIRTLLDLDKFAIESYLDLAKREQAKDSKKILANALSHVCRAMTNCDRLLAHSDDQELKLRKLDLTIKRAFIYKQMGLWKCHRSDLEQAIVLGKNDNPRFCQPSVHYALGMVYRKLNRFEEAREQFYIVKNSSKGANRSLGKKAAKQLNKIENTLRKSSRKTSIPELNENEIFTKFQDQNIREECLQILKDHYRANGKAHLNRDVPYWESFSLSIGATTTIKQFCEVILSSVLVSEKVSRQHLLRIANLSNVHLDDPKTLDEMKKYLQDAVKAYAEEKKQIEDQAIAELEKTKAEHDREKAFVDFRENLKIKLKDGELLRLGSQKREAISTLAIDLRGTEMDQSAILASLKEIAGADLVPDSLVFTEARVGEIVEILEAALDKEISPFQVKDHVLQIFGSNIFLSEIKGKIETALRADPAIYDVHIMGLQVYLDTSIKLSGINLAVGGEYIQFMPYKGLNGRDKAQKISFDLRGSLGIPATELHLPPASNGIGLCEKGTDGRGGNDADGGKPGGDFCIHATKQIAGDDDDIIEKIYLSGGTGGQGSRGQDGGNGRDGQQGEDGRDGVRDGDLADSSWGYIDMRHGKRGYRAGDGGEGGTGGRGGAGGQSGRFIIENGQDTLKGRVEANRGADGKDGDPGQGGKAGKAERDGLDRLYVKGGLFHSRKDIWGCELECKNSKKDREKESWVSRLTIAKSIERNQGKNKSRGKTAEEAGRRRREEKKNDLKQQMFKKGLAHHIHTQSAENKAGAFDEVTNRLAVIAETESVMVAQLHALQNRIGDIETLHQTTATILQQTQVQQNAQIQHSRLATFAPVEKTSNLKKEINEFFNSPQRDKENVLPLLDCSPVAHDFNSPHAVECAIHSVNATHGQNCHALAQLIDEIANLSEEDLHEGEKRTSLIHKLAAIIDTMPLRYSVDGFAELNEATANLDDADSLKQVVKKKEDEVKAFKRVIEDERAFINSEFESQIQQMSIKVGVLKFLYRMVFLLNKERGDLEKRKKWFDQALYQRIITCAHQVISADPSKEMLNDTIHDVQALIRPFTENSTISLKELRTQIVSERKALQKKVKTLRFQQGWILDHLNELCECQISPTNLRNISREEGADLEELYSICSRHWVNISPEPVVNTDVDEQSATSGMKDEELTDSIKWMQSIQQPDWDSQKVIRLERRVKELSALAGKLGDLRHYMEQLYQIYLDPTAPEELSDVFITILQTDRDAQESLKFVLEIKDLSDGKAIDELRKKFPCYFHNTNLTDLREQKLAEQINLYLQKKHVELIEKKCVAQMSEEFSLPSSQQKELEKIVHSLFKRVNEFYTFQLFLPEKNYLAEAEDLILEKKSEIMSSLMSKSEQTVDASNKAEMPSPPDLIDLILLHIVSDKIKLNSLDDLHPIIGLLQSSILEENFDVVRANLFLLINRDLSYSQTLKIIKILSDKKIINFADKKQKTLLETARELLLQKAESQQAKFRMQWQAVLEKGKQYDERRQQVDKEDRDSVQQILIDIAEDAELLASDEKIKILEQMITIMRGRGCVTSLSELQALRHQQIAKNGLLPVPISFHEQIDEYNHALHDVFHSKDLKQGLETLPDLLMKAIDLEIDENFLLPIFIAIKHLPLEGSQLINLMKEIEQLNVALPEKMELKERCLDKIRSLLVLKVRNKSQETLDQTHRVKEELRKAQCDILNKISPIIKESEVLHSNRHIARLELWLLRLDHYFEIEKKSDPTGNDRKNIYSNVVNFFMDTMQKEKTIEEGLVVFEQWLRTTFNQKKDSSFVVNRDSIKTLLNNLENVSTRNEAVKKLETFDWRGVLPYTDDDEHDSVLKYTQARNFDAKEKNIAELLKRIKLKFDDAMIQEECCETKAAIETFEINQQQARSAWLNDVEEWISNKETKIEDIERDYSDIQALKQKELKKNEGSEEGNPIALDVEEASVDFDLRRWLMQRKENEKDAAFRMDMVRPKIDQFLQDFEDDIANEELIHEDIILLKKLNQFVSSLHEDSLLIKIKEVERQVIERMDSQETAKKDAIDQFVAQLNTINAFKKPIQHNSTDPFVNQYLKDIKQLEKSLESCRVVMGDELFFLFLERISHHFEGYQGRINLQMVANLFWVLPRLNDPNAAFEVLSTRLPEHWTLALLEQHCLETVLPILVQREFSPVNTHGLSDQEKEDLINKIVNEKDEQSAANFEQFKEILNQLKSSKEMGVRDKETLLRLIATRLTKSQETKLEFSLEDFNFLLEKYLLSPCVLKKLTLEFSQPSSTVITLLLQPSFESFKYALTLAWMQGMLEPPRLNPAIRQKLYDSLFEIESTKKVEIMQKVVESLHGGLMTPAVVECVANFADKSWELDEKTLDILKKRDSSGTWYSEIEAHTKSKRSEKRDLKKLVSLMEQESEGINQSIQDLLVGEDPQLVKDIKDIEAKFKSGICHKDADAIKKWAQENRSTRFLEDPEKLKEGIAMVSRANELFTEKNQNGTIEKGYQLRHTQMIALWLMLRKGSGEPKGRISQMFTGEGKSITFASLAVLRAMNKSNVDVVTTSIDLAERDASAMKDFFDYFDLTVSNNCDQKCEQDEEVRKSRYFADGKPIDIIYGDVASFERDLLLTEFHGKEIIHSDRLGSNRSVLVDEVDGLFLDNAGMVLYLSHSVDTLRFLERIFTQVWTVANQPYFATALPFDDKAVEAIVKVMKGKLEANEIPLPNYELSHAKYMEMKAVIDRKLSTWVRSALYAKMISVNNEYVINDRVTGKKVKREIIAMDKGTGIEQFSLKWSQGLHQFLQLKHGLELTPDSLKAVFLSNYFFFKRYSQNIYGLSGTIGSDTEQKYLQNLYQVDLCKIPRFAGEKYIQYKAVVTGTSEEWMSRIEQSIDRQVRDKKRAALVICESIEEVARLKDHLKERYPSTQVYTSYLDKPSFVANENASELAPGDIMLATNLAGRGTDLKTTKQLEANGGLHVILSYVPSNIRIQDQAFGRTARSGNEGSGEFIVLDSQRRDISEQCRVRDWEEKQRLENVATKEVKKNEFEHELLRGFTYHGENNSRTEKISGFQSILESIQDGLKGEEPFYREAQINSLKNRWAFWMDHMEEKIKMVHAIGKDLVVASFKEFERGVYADLNAGGYKLVKEPIELIKLGGEYRRREMWSQAQACYHEAAKDPHYRYVAYYEASCELIQSPSSSPDAKMKFKRQAKEAVTTIKSEISQLQTSIQNVAPIVEKYRLRGQADRGNPYQTRSQEKIQIWSIFLSAIDAAIGGSFSEESIKKSSFAEGNRPREIIDLLGDRFKPMRLSKKLTIGEEDIFFNGKPLSVPKMFGSMLKDFKAIESIQGVRKIDKPGLLNYCSKVVTKDGVKQYLNCEKTIYQLSSIPKSFEEWPKDQQYSEQVKFVLSSLVDEMIGESPSNSFSSHEEIRAKLTEKFEENSFLKDITVESFFQTLVKGKFIVDDFVIDLSDLIVQVDRAPRKFSKLKELQKEGFTEKFKNFPKELQEAIFKASRDKKEDGLSTVWSLKAKISMGELALPQSTSDAADILWTLLEEREAIKPSKIQIGNHNVSKQIEKIKEDVTHFLKHAFPDDKKLEEAVDSICDIIESGIGMIYKLENKKTTAEFADIIRKYFHDHKQHAPEGLEFFIELGLEVIADLVEKKDPPAWFETLAVTVMGVIQMVAGVIIKAYLPVVGDLIGNALISTGMDDVMFAIHSAVSGQFSWDDYADAKVQSLKRSIISSALSCGIAFGVSAIGSGSVGGAWDALQMTGADRAAQSASVAGGTFNLGTHILKEVGRNVISMGISQLASRGLEGMTKLISGSYESKVRKAVEDGVNAQWHQVVSQADALYQKVGGDPSVINNVDECLNLSIKRLADDNAFDGAIRASKQVMPQAASLIGDKGWSSFVSHAPDIANLGVSIPKLTHLVEDGVRQFSRQIRETKERKTETASNANSIAKASFDSQLQEKKTIFINKLVDSFNGILNGAVFTPLTSMGAQALAQVGKNALIPLSEQEKWAQSPDQLAKILEAKSSGNEALADQLLMAWRGASDEVVNLSQEELQKTPVNAGQTIEAMKEQYGDHLRVYKDKEGHLYVQRPSRQEYAASLDANQRVSEPAIVALSHVVNKKIAVRSPAGTSIVYSPDGSAAPLEIEPIVPLEIERVDDTEVGLEKPLNLDSTNMKDFQTLLDACRSQGCIMDSDSLNFKDKIASTLLENEDCKRFYHNWSLGEEQHFEEDRGEGGNGFMRRLEGILHGAVDHGIDSIQYYQTVAAHMGIGRPPLSSNPLDPFDHTVREEYNQQWIAAVNNLQAHDKNFIDEAIMKGLSIDPQDSLYQFYRNGTSKLLDTLDTLGTIRDAYHSIKDVFGHGPASSGVAHMADSKATSEIKFFDSISSHDQTKMERKIYPHSGYWKHETQFDGIRVFQRDDLIDPMRTHPKTGETSLSLMERGKAAIGPDGKPIVLHHTIQRQGYPMAEVSGTFHEKNHSIIHVNPSKIPSGIPRKVHGNWRDRYWLERAKDYRTQLP